MLPVDQTADPSMQCSNDMVGGRYDPFGMSGSQDCSSTVPSE